MTKLVRLPTGSYKGLSCCHPEVDRLFREEKVIDWRVNDNFIFLVIHNNEDVKLQ
jgi:hypothetical protein